MPGVKRKRSSSTRSSKRSRRGSMTRRRANYPRGMRVAPSTHSFHRWITAFPNASGIVSVTNAQYNITTSVLTSSDAVSGTQTCEMALAFPFNALPNVTEFTNLFDAYMITKVIVQIKMVTNPDSNFQPMTTTNSSGNIYPTIWYTPDYDDSQTVSLAQIKEFERVKHKVLYPNRMVNIVVRPKPVTQIFRTAITTGYQVHRKSLWLDCGQIDIPHYGLKTVIDFEGTTAQGVSGNPYLFKINCKYYFKCRSAR